MAEKSRANFI